MARKYSNTSVETTLSTGIDSSQTSITVNDTGGLPATFPYSLTLDFEQSTVEIVTVTNLSGGTLTVTRGQDGTAAQSHDAGAVVVHGATARDLSEPQLHIDDSNDVHGVGAGSAIVGTDTTQVLTNKTISGANNTLTGVDGDTLANPLDASSVDATFNSVTLSSPDPDLNVGTELASLRSDVDTNTSDIGSLEDLNPTTQIREIGENFQDFTSTDFGPTSTPCDTTFTANGVGRAVVHYAIRADADVEGEEFQAGIIVNEDDENGDPFVTIDSNDCISKFFTPRTLSESFSYWRFLSGLTAGATYFVQLQIDTHNTTVDILNQKLIVVPVP